MRMSETLLSIILLLIAIFGTLITKVLVPYLQSKLKQEDLKLLSFWVEIALYAAEQKYKETNKGLDKKQFVKMFLKEKIPELTDEQADMIIEGIGKSLGIFKEV
jgi:hypothetical protein